MLTNGVSKPLRDVAGVHRADAVARAAAKLEVIERARATSVPRGMIAPSPVDERWTGSR